MVPASNAYTYFSHAGILHPLGWTFPTGGLNARGTDARCGGHRRRPVARRGDRPMVARPAVARMECATGFDRPVGEPALATPAPAGAGAAGSGMGDMARHPRAR